MTVIEKQAIVEKLQGILIEVLNHDDFEIKDDLEAKDVEGWDSLSHALIIMAIEKNFEAKFSLREINKLKNMGNLIDLIFSKS